LHGRVGSEGKAIIEACLLYLLETVSNIVFQEGWGPVGQVKRIVVFVEEPKGRGKPPFEEKQRAMEGQKGALRKRNAVVL
jgi:hypothetical protein